MTRTEQAPLHVRVEERQSPTTYRLLQPSQFFDELQDRIPRASSFTFDVYTFKPDERGSKILQAVKERVASAKDRGEDFVSYGTIDHVFDPLHDNGIPTLRRGREAEEQAEETLSQFKELSEVDIDYTITNQLKINVPPVPKWASVVNFVHKNHNKLYKIVDIDPISGEKRTTVYIGGVNVEQNNWKDYMVAVEGPAADVLGQHIDDQYKKSKRKLGWTEDYKEGKDITVKTDGVEEGRFLTDTFRQKRATGYIHDRVKQAQERAWRASPYFGVFIERRRLIQAAKNGADARLLSAGDNNTFLANWLLKSRITKPLRWLLIDSLTRNGVRVFLPDGMVHAKGGIVDDEALVTSSNGSFGFFSGWNQEDLWASKNPSLVTQVEGWMNNLMQPEVEYRAAESAKARERIAQKIAGRRTKAT
jgi:phosphatidylserine/phosphatidylglycerophosphate/cardiolipin synthase-like enzyme